MSKRLRREENYELQLKAEEAAEGDKLKEQQERIFAPLVWCRLRNGFKIIDLKPNRYDEVLDLIKEEYIPREVLCRNTEIESDTVSMKSLLDHIMFTIRDCSSIIIVNENNRDELAGVLLLRVTYKFDAGRTFSRVVLKDGEARGKCLAITTALNRRIDIFSSYNCDSFLRYYLCCVKEKYAHTNCEYQLMRVGLDVARTLGTPIVTGIFTGHRQQNVALKLNFELFQEIHYINWRDKENEIIISDPGAGNYTCSLMVGRVPLDRTKDPFVLRTLSPAELRRDSQPRTRLEKRRALRRKSGMY